jgi:hypothetical protein
MKPGYDPAADRPQRGQKKCCVRDDPDEIGTARRAPAASVDGPVVTQAAHRLIRNEIVSA